MKLRNSVLRRQQAQESLFSWLVYNRNRNRTKTEYIKKNDHVQHNKNASSCGYTVLNAFKTQMRPAAKGDKKLILQRAMLPR